MYICIYIDVFVYMHQHTHIYIYNICTHIHAYIHKSIYIQAHTYTHMFTHTHSLSLSRTHAHTHTRQIRTKQAVVLIQAWWRYQTHFGTGPIMWTKGGVLVKLRDSESTNVQQFAEQMGATVIASSCPATKSSPAHSHELRSCYKCCWVFANCVRLIDGNVDCFDVLPTSCTCTS